MPVFERISKGMLTHSKNPRTEELSFKEKRAMVSLKYASSIMVGNLITFDDVKQNRECAPLLGDDFPAKYEEHVCYAQEILRVHRLTHILMPFSKRWYLVPISILQETCGLVGLLPYFVNSSFSVMLSLMSYEELSMAATILHILKPSRNPLFGSAPFTWTSTLCAGSPGGYKIFTGLKEFEMPDRDYLTLNTGIALQVLPNRFSNF